MVSTMQFKIPKDNKKLAWTQHVIEKMKFYNLSLQQVKNVFLSPKRVEHAIVENCIACMKPALSKRKQEIWVMYRKYGAKIKIITAWRYPGVSPVSESVPIPQNILEELKNVF